MTPQERIELEKMSLAHWMVGYANEFGINQWWVLPANITMAICLVGAAFWLAAGIAEILEG